MGVASHEHPARYLTLDDATTLAAAQSDPQGFLAGFERPVVIDEIQRLPHLLNQVHRLIEEKGVRFLLTGSSARKLRRGGVNLLGGRARTKHLHPLTAGELGSSFDLSKALRAGLFSKPADYRLNQWSQTDSFSSRDNP